MPGSPVRSSSRSVVCQAKKGTQAKGTQAKRSVASPVDQLWLPNTARPEWLDGTLPGDRGFDPLGLAKRNTFIAIGIDEQDQNQNQNLKGGVESIYESEASEVSPSQFAPYNEVFGIQRFRENEIQHGRWAMLGCLGCLVGELVTGVSWVDASKYAYDGKYAGLELPWSINQVIYINVILMAGVEIFRNSELDLEKRLYPGGAFDPFGFASGDEEKVFRLRTAEIKHCRLAMVAFLGFGIQAFVTGEGVLGSLSKFTNSI